MKPGHYLLVLGLLFCMPAGAGSGSEDPSFVLPDEHTLARLRAGEVLLENETSDVNGAAAGILVFIRAPVERIWAIIISCQQASIWVVGLQYCEALEERGDYALTRQIVDKGWTTPRLDFTFETVRRPYQHMEFRLTQGNLKSMHGSFDFKTFPDGVLVRHAMLLQPLVPAPSWLVRLVMKKDLPSMMRCIRGLSLGSGSEQAIRADLLRCPGQAH
jgi:hypothetical protein